MKRISILLAFIVTAAVYAAITFTDSGPEYTDDYNTREQKILYNLAVIKTNTGSISGSVSVTNTVTVTNVVFPNLQSALNTLSNIYSSIYNTNGYAARTNHIRSLNLVVSTNTPTAQTNGSGVAGWADEYGRQRVKGYDDTSDSLKANVINQPEDQMLGGDGTWVPLLLVTNTQSSVWYDVSGYKYFTYFICPGTATNHVITCEVSPNSGTNWVGIYTNTITATNNICVSFGPIAQKYMRWSYTGTNETCTVNVVGKK